VVVRVRAALLFALALAAIAAGCGAGETEPEDAVVTAGQVVDRFRQEAGSPLLRVGGDDPAFEQLSFGLNPPKRLLDRYGVFSIYVVKPDRPEAMDSLLRDKGTGAPLEADGNGVYWERDTQSRSWVAYKRYGANAVLVWYGESPERVADARFRRLDRVLRTVEQDSVG
jgi:hypothetical protein